MQPPPLPVADFSLTFSSSTVSVTQGSTSNAVNVSVTAQNGFSGDVQVSWSGLPTGVTANPSGTFSVNAGTSAPIFFGASSSATQIQVLSPASTVSGAVGISAFFPDGWGAFAPDAFSYGPQILELLPNAGNKNGNETISLYGYGFGTDTSVVLRGSGFQSGTKVTIGGKSATVSFKALNTLTFTTPSLTVGSQQVV